MGRNNEELTSGYYKVVVSEEEDKKQYEVNDEFLKKAFKHVERADIVRFLNEYIIKGTKQKKS